MDEFEEVAQPFVCYIILPWKYISMHIALIFSEDIYNIHRRSVLGIFGQAESRQTPRGAA